ncbi:hypothetical protein [Streptosporangium roseum]|uniref:Uncharacterized protein n=1 Tax=Streptosporangium roseum (strain ATCC 12428 / DSM 43021 / JCM 3005 / KCTC 9067 / NCIMB 10171 / NRRL 2505 / NI 9100) TaxID=479432 RepID=D2AQC1_STRRD|nr:hypothetical protein [Streptosporangium roseum]ACZ84465.1 hypothetical protein Sros_1472 [Streptosporangium roseum DSM 43021]
MDLIETPERARPGKGAVSRYGGATLLAALAMLLVQAALKAVIVAQAFFKEDDFAYAARSVESGFDPVRLTELYLGQFMPGGFAVDWVVTRLAPYDWTVVAAIVVAAHTLAGLAVYTMLVTLFGRRPLILAPLALWALAPASVPVLTWWAAALNTVPLQIALPMAVTAHVRHLRTGGGRHAAAALGWTVLGMLFFVKAAVIPLLLAALTWAYFGGLRGHGRVWLAHGATLAAFAGFYLVRSAGTPEIGGLPTLSDGLGFVGNLFGRTLLTTALGGPWTWFAGPDRALAAPPWGLVALSALVVAGLFWVTLRHRRRALAAWAILLGWVLLADVPPPLYGRVYLVGGFLGMDTRYIADALPVAAMVAGLLTLPLLGETAPYRRPLPRAEVVYAAGGVVVGGFTVASLVSLNAFLGHLGAPDKSAYLAAAREALSTVDRHRVIFDSAVPGFMLSSGYGEYGRTSRLLSPLADEERRRLMRTPPPATDGLVFDGEGRLRPVDVDGAKQDPPGGCWPREQGRITVPLPGAGELARLGTWTSGRTEVGVLAGADKHRIALPPGLSQLYLPLPEGTRQIEIIGIASDAKVCMGDVKVGKAVPSP